ncbi:unnamed protein product, partial [Owenia fusiformis]
MCVTLQKSAYCIDFKMRLSSYTPDDTKWGHFFASSVNRSLPMNSKKSQKNISLNDSRYSIRNNQEGGSTINLVSPSQAVVQRASAELKRGKRSNTFKRSLQPPGRPNRLIDSKRRRPIKRAPQKRKSVIKRK